MTITLLALSLLVSPATATEAERITYATRFGFDILNNGGGQGPVAPALLALNYSGSVQHESGGSVAATLSIRRYKDDCTYTCVTTYREFSIGPSFDIVGPGIRIGYQYADASSTIVLGVGAALTASIGLYDPSQWSGFVELNGPWVGVDGYNTWDDRSAMNLSLKPVLGLGLRRDGGGPAVLDARAGIQVDLGFTFHGKRAPGTFISGYPY